MIMLDVIIIGAGPIGLNAALALGKLQKTVLVLEGEDYVGGQLIRLYPEKEIVDIETIPSIKSRDYIISLQKEIEKYPNIKISLNSKVESIEQKNCLFINTQNETYQTKYLIIATGLGISVPRPLGLEHELECDNILYSLNSMDFLKDKSVLVLGGGDSALDWTKELSKICQHVTIIHRRKEFRGDINTIKGLTNITIKIPYIPYEIIAKDGKLTHLVIQNVENQELETLKADYVFVNFGNIPMVNTFNLESQNNGLVVNQEFQTSQKNVFAIGDVARYEGKKNRIQPGLDELQKVIKLID